MATKEELMKLLLMHRWNLFTNEELNMLRRALSVWDDEVGTIPRPTEFFLLRDELTNEVARRE